MHPSTRRHILFTLVAVTLFFASVEGVLRLLDYPPGALYRTVPGVRWSLQPNLHRSPMVHHESGRTFHVSTDHNGLRLTPGAGTMPQGCLPYRILLLGDSNTFGWGLDDDETWAASLQQALSDRAVQVINGGMPGYTLAQCFELYRRVGVTYDPDMVVLSVGMHDMAPLPAPRTGTRPPGVALATRRSLLSHLRLVRLLRMAIVLPRLDHLSGRGEGGGTGRNRPEGARPKIPAPVFEQLLNAFSDEARGKGFLLVSAPIPGINTSKYLPIMARLGNQGRLLHLVVTPARPYERLPGDPEHLGVDGARRFGQDLARSLAAYLPSPCKVR